MAVPSGPELTSSPRWATLGTVGIRTKWAVAGALALALAGAAAVFAWADVACTGGVCMGTADGETLAGTADTDYIYAGDGDDFLRGKGDFDELRGEDGDDKLDAGRGSDQYAFYGESWDRDRIVADASGKKDWLIFFTDGNLQVELQHQGNAPEVTSGGNSIQVAKGVTLEWVQAGDGSDEIFGNAADNQINGSDEGDLIAGRAGDDSLYGDIDVFVGNEGDDEIRAGTGRDIVNGERGNDTIYVRDGQKDKVECGDGIDTVAESDAKDVIDDDCETVRR
jgi:Ca2+-binding RTX toxin-like protein